MILPRPSNLIDYSAFVLTKRWSTSSGAENYPCFVCLKNSGTKCSDIIGKIKHELQGFKENMITGAMNILNQLLTDKIILIQLSIKLEKQDRKTKRRNP